MHGEFPGDPVVGTQRFHTCSPEFNPWSGKQALTSSATKAKESKWMWGYPGGSVVKSSAKAGHTGSIPGPGRSHMPWNN